MSVMDKNAMMKRTRDFALRSVRLWQALPQRTDAEVLGKQLLRAATSVGANYRSACHAKSSADFLAKLKICEEEADECEYWLELMVAAEVVTDRSVAALRCEAHELASMFTAGTRTAGTRTARASQNNH